MPLRTLDEFLRNTRQEPKTIETTKATFLSSTVKITGFYKETDFKQTPIGKIPKQWRIVRLENVAEVVNGYTFPLGLQGKKTGKFPFLKVGDMNKAYKYIFDADNYVDESDLRKLKAKPFPKGTIIFPKIGMAMRLNKFRILGQDALFDNNVAGIIAKNVYNEFLYYYFVGKINLISLAGTTTVPSITKTKLKKLIIPLPSLEEQWGVAEVLSSVDRAIEKTEELIGRLERLRKALMQELLTKGIGHKEYKQTPIGKMPKEWRVVRLGSLGNFQYGITISACKENTGIKLLRITDIKNGIIDWENMPYCKISLMDFKKYKVHVGDVLLARISATTGKTCYVNEDKPAVFGSYLIRFIPFSNEIDTKYLYYFTQSTWYWNQVDKLKGGQLKKGLNTKLLATIKVPLPPLTEQRRIANILSVIDEWILNEREYKKKLERLKKGLMNLLLTGRIRVKVKVVNASNVQGSDEVLGDFCG